MSLLSRFACLLATLVFTLSLASTTAFAADDDPAIGISHWGTGSGKVTAPGLDCINEGSNCRATYPLGSTVTVTATPAPGSVFAGWNGACYGASGDQCTLVVDGYKGVYAIFELVGAAPELLASTGGPGGAINSLGEAVWTEWDNATKTYQVFSSQRGQLTTESCSHGSPAINNLGDVIWNSYGCTGPDAYSIQGVIGGRPEVVTAGPAGIGKIDINDRREVVWSQADGDSFHIYSNLRGLLTSPTRSSYQPDINNLGDLVFIEYDPVLRDPGQVFKLPAGSGTPVAVTADSVPHMDASISDSGEIVWSEFEPDTFNARVVSSQRGTLVPLVTGAGISAVDVNNCGDLLYTTGFWQLFRLGSNSPCVDVTGTHDTREQAAPVALGDIFTALADGAAAPLSWYRFDASAGDNIHVSVNFDNRPPNILRVGLYDSQGNYLYDSESFDIDPVPRVIDLQASYTGSYILRIESQAGTFGYNVSLSKYTDNCGAGPCRETIRTGSLKDGVSINSRGESVWSELDPFTGYYQIFYNYGGVNTGAGRGTTDPYDHIAPAINAFGDYIWRRGDAPGTVEGFIAGKRVTITSGGNEVGGADINGLGEVVWSQRDASGIFQLHSNKRGQLTSAANDCTEPSLDNRGNIAYIENDRNGHLKVMKIPAGSTAPVTVQDGLDQAWSLSIADSGELTWIRPGAGADEWLISSTSRGTVVRSPFALRSADVNACGDLIYSARVSDALSTLYRLGESAPCLSFPGSHDSMEQAAAVAMGDVFSGVVDGTLAPVTWYRFEAGAGDTVHIRLNYDSAPYWNYASIALHDANGNLVKGPLGGAPREIYHTLPAGGVYFVKVEGVGRSGYVLSLDKYLPPVWQPVQFPLDVEDTTPAINSLGEVVWSQMDYVIGTAQIFSSTRGQLTFDPVNHFQPAINDLGDLVWIEPAADNSYAALKGIIGGKTVTIEMGQLGYGQRIALSNSGEVVYSRFDANWNTQVYSSTRGQLTADAQFDSWEPDVNNRGDVVFTRIEANKYWIYKLAAGSTVPVRVNPAVAHDQLRPAINDNGEILWNERNRLHTCLRGQLPSDAYYAYIGDINNCGDVVYRGWGPGYEKLYRIGYSSPCLTDPGAHDSREQAAPVSYGEVAVGLADSAAPVSWYRLEGSAGDTIEVRVHYDNTTPNTVVLGIYDAGGNLVAGPTGAIDRELDYSVPASGVYFLKVEGQGGRFGYALSAQRSEPSMLKLIVEGQPDAYFATFADLFSQEAPSAELKLFCRSGDLAGDVAINQCGKVVRVAGGYDSLFAAAPGRTRIAGRVKLTCGNLVVDGLTLR